MNKFVNYKGGEIIIASPSGSGKSSLIKNLIEKHPRQFTFPILTTTRKERKDDKKFKRKTFVSKETFNKKLKNKELLMSRISHGGIRYGMEIKNLEKACKTGKTIILDTCSVKGLKKIKSVFPKSRVIVIMPFKNLKSTPRKRIRSFFEKRLSRRKDVSKEEIKKRVQEDMKNIFYIAKYADEIVINPASKAHHPTKKVCKELHNCCLNYLKNIHKK